MSSKFESITIKTKVNAPVEKVWKRWTAPEDVMQWNTASDDWHTTHSENDLRTGGSFISRMESKDGQFGFDFGGTYEEVVDHKKIIYVMSDGRKVDVRFEADGDVTNIVETFDAETENSVEMQRDGWQAILDNFKKYTEEKN